MWRFSSVYIKISAISAEDGGYFFEIEGLFCVVCQTQEEGARGVDSGDGGFEDLEGAGVEPAVGEAVVAPEEGVEFGGQGWRCVEVWRGRG